MRQYFMELSKYGIMLCMVLYTITSTVSLFLRSKGKVAAYIVQCVFLFLTQLICFLSLALAGKDDKYFLLYAYRLSSATTETAAARASPAKSWSAERLRLKRMQYSCRQLWSCSHLPWKVPARRWLSALRSHFKSPLALCIHDNISRPGQAWKPSHSTVGPVRHGRQ